MSRSVSVVSAADKGNLLRNAMNELRGRVALLLSFEILVEGLAMSATLRVFFISAGGMLMRYLFTNAGITRLLMMLR